jgi:hypothetical protein
MPCRNMLELPYTFNKLKDLFLHLLVFHAYINQFHGSRSKVPVKNFSGSVVRRDLIPVLKCYSCRGRCGYLLYQYSMVSTYHPRDGTSLVRDYGSKCRTELYVQHWVGIILKRMEDIGTP